MAKADRLARMDVLRADLEADYAAALIAALQTTAAGKWGLFDHNGDRWARASVEAVVNNLTDLADAIDEARDRLGLPPYELHQQFLASRGPVGPEAVGEPKQAQAWLALLKKSGSNEA